MVSLRVRTLYPTSDLSGLWLGQGEGDMISRRGFFGMVAGLAATPAISKLERFIPIPDQPVLSPDEMLQQLAEEMSYRLALTLDYLVRITYDGQVADPIAVQKISHAEYFLSEAA